MVARPAGITFPITACPTATMTTTAALSSAEPSPALREHVRSLGRHLRHCHQARGRFFHLTRVASDMHDWVAPRFVTTLTLAAACIALASL